MLSNNSYKSLLGKLSSLRVASNVDSLQFLTLFSYTILYSTWEDFAFKIPVLPFLKKLRVLATPNLYFLVSANGHN